MPGVARPNREARGANASASPGRMSSEPLRRDGRQQQVHAWLLKQSLCASILSTVSASAWASDVAVLHLSGTINPPLAKSPQTESISAR